MLQVDSYIFDDSRFILSLSLLHCVSLSPSPPMSNWYKKGRVIE